MITTRRIFAALAAALVLALGAGPAWAGQYDVNGNGSLVQVPPPGAGSASGQSSALSGPSSAPTIVHVTAGNSGFDWGDAGIGAAAGVAVCVLLLAGGIAVVQRRSSSGRVHHA